MLKNLLVFRIALFNIIMLALLGAAATQGWVQYVFQSDHSRISYLISGVFALTVVGTIHRAIKVGNALNSLKSGEEVDRREILKMPIKNAYLHTATDSLTGLAIVGTVIGMVLMTKNLDLANPNLGELVSGIGVAFMATLTGIATAMWAAVNIRMLDTATALLVKDSE